MIADQRELRRNAVTGVLIACALLASACSGGSESSNGGGDKATWLVEEGSLAGTLYCDTVAAIPMLSIDAPGGTATFLDGWSAVDDAPEAVSDDVAAVVDYAELVLNGTAPRLGSTFAARLERMLDAGVQGCPDLPTRIGHADDWAVDLDWSDATTNSECAGSLHDLETGWQTYREIRPNELRHGEQIEVATFVEWLRWLEDQEERVDWMLGPNLHGLSFETGVAEAYALEPCTL